MLHIISIIYAVAIIQCHVLIIMEYQYLNGTNLGWYSVKQVVLQSLTTRTQNQTKVHSSSLSHASTPLFSNLCISAVHPLDAVLCHSQLPHPATNL